MSLLFGDPIRHDLRGWACVAVLPFHPTRIHAHDNLPSQPLPLALLIHPEWVQYVERGRRSVVDAFLRKQCEAPGVVEVQLVHQCDDARGTKSYHLRCDGAPPEAMRTAVLIITAEKVIAVRFQFRQRFRQPIRKAPMADPLFLEIPEREEVVGELDVKGELVIDDLGVLFGLVGGLHLHP